jgi:hypothetical protein
MPDIAQSEVDALGGFKLIAQRFGGTPQSILDKLEKMEDDNRKQRDEIRDLKASQPKEGQVVVAKTDAEELEQYRALGKPGELKTKLETGEKAGTELAQVQLRTSAEKFANVVGLAPEAVDTLIAIPALQGAKFEVRKGKVKNKAGQEVDGEVGYITLPGDNQRATTFADSLEAVPALKGLARATTSGTSGESGRDWTAQGGGTEGKGGSIYDQIRAEKQAAQQGHAPAATSATTPAPLSVEQKLGMSPR